MGTQEMKDQIIQGDALEVLREMPDQSVHCCVTSPPYWGLRDYGVDGQLGLERTPEEYVAKLVEVFREVRRVLRDDGTLWLNLGDSYVGGGRGGGMEGERGAKQRSNQGALLGPKKAPSGLKPKNLVGIPWRVAFALQADGWCLRSDIIWAKPNPMPESVKDRPTTAHEHVFLLSKSQRYYYDRDAVKEPCIYGDHYRNGVPGTVVQAPGQAVQSGITQRRSEGTPKIPSGWDVGPGSHGKINKRRGHPREHEGSLDIGTRREQCIGYRNRRSVWTVATYPFPDSHFATFPPNLIRPCILAGCPSGSIVLDPFFGAGTTGVVAKQEGRHYIGIELNPEYVGLAEVRINRECPMERLIAR